MYYAFDDGIIQDVVDEHNIDIKANYFSRHLGNFVRDHVEDNMTDEILKNIDADEYAAANEMIRKALIAYTELSLEERKELLMREINALTYILYQEELTKLTA
jgi:DNA-directed RNA polymerase specialized sigma24 family protein